MDVAVYRGNSDALQGECRNAASRLECPHPKIVKQVLDAIEDESKSR
jgi:hypothetical protein